MQTQTFRVAVDVVGHYTQAELTSRILFAVHYTQAPAAFFTPVEHSQKVFIGLYTYPLGQVSQSRIDVLKY